MQKYFVEIYYNQARNGDGKYIANSRGYNPLDRMRLAWEKTVEAENHKGAADAVRKEIKELDNYSIERILGLQEISRGDVVYFPEDNVALARTERSWKPIENFKKPADVG